MNGSEVKDAIWGSAMDGIIYSMIGGPDREEIYKKLKNPNLKNRERKYWMNRFLYVCKYERKTGKQYTRILFTF
jgi:hypothetical protein